MLLRHLLILGLPLITFLLESLDLALEVSGLDVGLSEPIKAVVSMSCPNRQLLGKAARQLGSQANHVLLVCLTERLVGLLSLLLEQL